MAVRPEHFRAARRVVPRVPLSAILGFALFGVGGSVFLSYTSFSHADADGHHFAAPSSEPQVYEARAVPFDPHRESPAERTASIARALAVMPEEEVRRAETAESEQQRSEQSDPVLLEKSERQWKGEFSGFRNFGAANTYLALNGVSSGITALSASPGFMAADAQTAMSSAPEPSTWISGTGLLILIAGRVMRAHLYRKRLRRG